MNRVNGAFGKPLGDEPTAGMTRSIRGVRHGPSAENGRCMFTPRWTVAGL
jgi:hypothetical protein